MFPTTNRSKNSKRKMSLRKSKMAKSPITKKRTQQSSLGLPVSLALTPPSSKTPNKLVRDRPKSANSTASKQMEAALQNLFEHTSIKPRSWKATASSQSTVHSHQSHHNQISQHTPTPIDDEEADDVGFLIHPPSLNTDNASASSISDILGTMSSLHEDSDDEERTKAMFSKLDHMNLGSTSNHTHNNHNKKKSIRKIQSHPVISGMQHTSNSTPNTQSLFAQTDAMCVNKRQKMMNSSAIVVHKTRTNQQHTTDTSPSSESTANSTEKESMESQSIQRLRYRSQSMSSNPSMDAECEEESSYHDNYIKSVPEANAIIKTQDGLMTYIGNNNNDNALPLTRAKTHNSQRSRDHPHHRSLSSLGKDKNSKRHKLQKRKRGKLSRNHYSHDLGYRQENIIKRDFFNNCNTNANNDNVEMITEEVCSGGDDEEESDRGTGVKCEMKLNSEWDCLTVSTDQEWVALFSRNSMTLLRITEYGEFEQLRDLKAGRKDSRLKYGAVDAQFYYNDANKMITCTRSGTLIVLNLNFAGRGCIALTNCPLKQRVHKVTWIKETECCLAAAEDGKCYLWDTRCNPNPHLHGMSSFNCNSSALSVKTSPFNDNLFASCHKNGTLSVWDIRNESAPFLTMTAHKSSINCIDWHPAIPNVIASCGYRDITIKIWNLTDDDVAQSRYRDYWNKVSSSQSDLHSVYNYEDDYRIGEEVSTPPASSAPALAAIPNNLKPNCSMYPSGHVSQIGWRPCHDPRSLSANQIACSYVGSEQVVEMWDIKSSYVPVASLSSHESETKFKFIHKERPFLSHSHSHLRNTPRTYIITCSKDKWTKLTDCGYADIPRSKLSSCALDIAPFGSTCFVSVARQKLHPFGEETYEDVTQNEETRTVAIGRDDGTEMDSDESPPRESSISSDTECDSELLMTTRSVSTILSGIFSKKKKEKSSRSRRGSHCNEDVCSDINAMSGGIKQSKILQLTDLLNHVDAFSAFETKLTCYPLSETEMMQLSPVPCDSALTFKYLAKHYKLSGSGKGRSIAWICRENERVAQYINNSELERLWHLLAVLLQNVLSSNNNELPAMMACSDAAAHAAAPEIVETEEEEQEAEEAEEEENIDIDWCWWMHLDQECNISEYISSASNHSYLSLSHSQVSNDVDACAPLKQLEYALNDDETDAGADAKEEEEAAMVARYIKDVLLENMDRGDIQTAVTIIVMLDEYITQYLSQQEIADIVLSYLDLLLHSRLLIEAVKVYKLTKHHPLIESYFLSKHRLIIKCTRCKDTMRDYQCFKCRKYARCSQCNEELIEEMNNNHKLLIWCQICGHGGHFDHMKSWFVNKTICCIDNCSHQCQPVLIAMQSKR